MKEYNSAVERGGQESSCNLCKNASGRSLKRHEAHKIWHKKFRLFFFLRKKAFPSLVDRDVKHKWTAAEQSSVLDALVNLWRQVDREAPWFASPLCTKGGPKLAEEKIPGKSQLVMSTGLPVQPVVGSSPDVSCQDLQFQHFAPMFPNVEIVD